MKMSNDVDKATNIRLKMTKAGYVVDASDQGALFQFCSYDIFLMYIERALTCTQ